MQSLKRTDSNYKRLLANETEAVMVLGESVEDCNASALALLRCERNDLVGHPLQRRAPPLQPDGAASTEVLRQRMEAARGGSRHWFPWQFVLADGAPIETLVQLEAMELDGQPHWLVRLADLSRLRQAERALQETESRLQQILEHSPTVVFVKDIEGRYLFTNQRFREMFPPSNGSDTPTRDKELFPPEVVARLRADERLVLEKRSPIEVEEDLVVAGKECTYLVVKFPLLDGNGDPYAVCGIATDITARKRNERALRSAALAVSSAEGNVVFQALTRYLATILGVDGAFIAQCTSGDAGSVRTLAVYTDDSFEDNIEYALSGTVCGTVVGNAFRFIPSGVRRLFPHDPMFRRLSIEGYAAYPLSDSAGSPLGLIAALSRHPMGNAALTESMLKIFAARAATELERKRAEEARRVSEASYRAIFEAAEDAIFIHDWHTGAIVDVNPKACRAYGYSCEEMKHLGVADISSGEHPYTAEEAGKFLRAAREGTPVRFEWHRKNRDGSLHWDEVCLKSTVLGGEKRIVAFAREITERKRAEEALRNAALTVSTVQGDTVFEDLVRGLTETLGVDIAYIAQFVEGSASRMRRVALIVNGEPKDAEEFDLEGTPCETVVGRQFRFYPERLQDRFPRGDLRGFVPESYAAFPLSDTQGVPLGLIAVANRKPMADPARFESVLQIFAARAASEIERRRADETMRAREERYRAIFNAAADAVVLRDADFHIVDVNPAYSAITGYERDEVIGTDRVIAESLGSDGLQALHQRALAGETVQAEALGVRKDGTRIFIDQRLVPIAHEGKPHVLHVGRDITARKHAEAERASLETQLRQAQKMEAIGHLTGGIAHDFNNILTSIMGYVVLAMERQAALGDAKLSRFLEQTRVAATRARDLIQQMLTFSRGQRGEPRPIALPALLKESVKLLRSTLPSSIEIDTELDNDTPAAMLDPVQVDQVLLNLSINARDAMHSVGTIQVRLGMASEMDQTCASCRKSVRGSWVELSVSDTGSGIAPEVLDRMFEPFFSTKEVGKGSGMGLSTVHGIVHEQGGHILVDTELGQGTTFRILFSPLADGQGPRVERERKQLVRTQQARLAGRVLVVDDEEMVGQFMKELLESWGLEVVVKTNALDAQMAFEAASRSFDLVVTDQTMPRMTGVELTRQLLTVRPDLAVVLYTGFSDAPTSEEIKRCGVSAVVAKPVEPDTLFSVLSAHLLRTARVAGS